MNFADRYLFVKVHYFSYSLNGILFSDLLLVFVFTNCRELSGVPQGANGCTDSISTKITYFAL